MTLSTHPTLSAGEQPPAPAQSQGWLERGRPKAPGFMGETPWSQPFCRSQLRRGALGREDSAKSPAEALRVRPRS